MSVPYLSFQITEENAIIETRVFPPFSFLTAEPHGWLMFAYQQHEVVVSNRFHRRYVSWYLRNLRDRLHIVGKFLLVFPQISTFSPTNDGWHKVIIVTELVFLPQYLKFSLTQSLFYSSPLGNAMYVVDQHHCYPGQMVAVHLSNDHWYRATIVGLALLPFMLIDVFYIDFGIHDSVPLQNIRHLQINFTQLPIQGLHRI